MGVTMKRLLFLVFVLPALALGASIINSFDAPDTGISSLTWDGVNLWALDGTTQNVYKLDPTDGDVLSSFYITDQTPTYNPVPGGMVYLGGSLYVAMHLPSTYGNVYKYDTNGTLQSEFNMYC
jgi:outer membrane protein assembly factor BamB